MWRGITLIIEGTGLSFETIAVLIILLGGMVFYAKNFKLGLIIQSVVTGLLFIWFYESSMDWAPALIIFLITFVILCFSLYAVSKEGAKGAII